MMNAPLGQQAFTVGQPAQAKPAQPQQVQWKPKPSMGRPKGTLSGGRRGNMTEVCKAANGEEVTAAALLVTDDPTSLLTAAATPTVSWLVQTAHPVTMQFVLTHPNQADPILTKSLVAEKSGLMSVQLPPDVALKVGSRYRWTVLITCEHSLVPEVFLRSFIERIELSGLAGQIAGKSPMEQAQVFAQHGLWYDTVNALVIAARKKGDSAVAKAELRSLFNQANHQPNVKIAQMLDLL